jgi:transposase
MSFQCVIVSALLKVNAVQSALTAKGVDIFSQESHFAERCARGLHRRQFRRGQKRGRKVGKTKRGKGTKIMAVADRNGLPVSVCIESATPHEVTLATSTLLQMVVPDAPQNLIGDNAYDSDRLDAELSLYGIQLIAPHRRKRKNPTQDGRRLNRYRRRWKIERLFAWLQNFRRLVVRYERRAENFLAMLHLAASLILLRQL